MAPEPLKEKPILCTYLLRCADGSLYCGWTNDLAHRLRAHNTGHGARYTRSRLPVKPVYLEVFSTPREAQRREVFIKRMTKAEKEALVTDYMREHGQTDIAVKDFMEE